MDNAEICCCGKRLAPVTPVRAPKKIELEVHILDNEYHISSCNSMTKQDYISFVALVSADNLHLIKLYPEWEMDVFLPFRRRGTLVWHSTTAGLMWQPA